MSRLLVGMFGPAPLQFLCRNQEIEKKGRKEGTKERRKVGTNEVRKVGTNEGRKVGTNEVRKERR